PASGPEPLSPSGSVEAAGHAAAASASQDGLGAAGGLDLRPAEAAGERAPRLVENAEPHAAHVSPEPAGDGGSHPRDRHRPQSASAEAVVSATIHAVTA